LVNRPLSDAELAVVDALPWGAKPVTDHATVLGLPLCSLYTPVSHQNEQDSNSAKNELAKHQKSAYDKGIKGAQQRSALLKLTINPLPQRTLAFTAWIQSLVYYPATTFRPPAIFANLQNQAYSRLVLGRPWMKADIAHKVLKYTRVASGPDPVTAARLAAIWPRSEEIWGRGHHYTVAGDSREH
jgi:hypothetical protein